MIDFGYGVHLCRLREVNLDQLFQWRNDPSIKRWCRQYDDLSWSDHIRWFHTLPDRKDVSMYEVHSEKGLVGVCGLTDIDLINRRAEFSLYIGPDFQKHGLGKCALTTLLAHGFQNLGLNCIWGESFEGNPAMHLFKELGFRRDGVRPQFYFREGRFIDAYLFSIFSSEFISRHDPGGARRAKLPVQIIGKDTSFNFSPDAA